METAVAPELEAFNRYVVERLGGSLGGQTLEEALAKFREYQRQLSKLKAKIQQSEESAAREGTRPMTDDVIADRHARLDQLLAEEGITD